MVCRKDPACTVVKTGIEKGMAMKAATQLYNQALVPFIGLFFSGKADLESTTRSSTNTKNLVDSRGGIGKWMRDPKGLFRIN